MNHHSGWKISQCFLTNRRLFFYLAPALRYQIPLEDITNLAVEKLHYVLRRRESICLTYQKENGLREGKIRFIANDLEKWKKNIFQASLLKVDLKTIEKIAAQLDRDGRDILQYLWSSRYAKINEIAAVIDAPSHMHVLLLIRETINPIAEKVVGCPVLLFERSKADPETGEPVLFSWWLAGRPEDRTPSEDRLLDVFDEGSYIQVIMEVRGVEPTDLKLDIHGDRLTVRSHKIGASLRETFHLPAEVKPDNPQLHLKNNLLEIKLSKV